MKKVKTKTVIIGGSSGIGLAIAESVVNTGNQVIIGSRHLSKLAQAKKTINSSLVSIDQMDMFDVSTIRDFFQKIGKFDHLVIPGSEVKIESFESLTEEDARFSFDSKFWGPYRVIKAALPYLNTSGSITLFSGSASQRPVEGAEIVSAVNSAVEGLAKSLALSLAPIRVNVVLPGLTDTPAYENMGQAAVKQMFDAFAQKLVIPRPAKPSEIAQAALYLMQNNYVTGTSLLVDGGHALARG